MLIFLYNWRCPAEENGGWTVDTGKKKNALTPVLIILALVFLLLSGLTLFRGARKEVQAGRPQDRGEGSGVRSLTAVRVAPVRPGTIETVVMINGDVIARNQVSIYPAMPGKLTEARFGVGDQVNRGDVMAIVDPSRPGEVYSPGSVISTVSGTVLKAPYSPGDTVGTSSVVYVVGNLSGLLVETFVPERFVSAVHPGLAARVSLEALPGEYFPALVEEVSPVLDPASRTLKIRLRFSGSPDGRIRAGMFATVSLVTGTRENVPVIPRFAVINTYGSWFVFVVSGNNTALRRAITPGIENEEYVEILEGLEEGELVVTEGQNFLSDGDPVRVLE
ncbi:MAG: efflux RND transporter periplasmic adaptor subunit [Treponema sp.]|jgi:multidrug efflux pump subunit AcrA (membrane-fusion protein)|nr:efflux RND transporter periplasmic adaptor subunit [Treponema sp.]